MRLNEIIDVKAELEHMPPNYITLIKNAYKNKAFLFRGINTDKPFIISDGTNMNRVPSGGVGSTNILNRLTEVLPSWKGWPPRTKSYSCTSRLRTAKGWSSSHKTYNSTFVVIPLENQPIAFIDSGDFWNISSNLGKFFFGEENDWLGFGTANSLFRMCIETAGGKHSALDTPQKIISDLKRFYNKYKKDDEIKKIVRKRIVYDLMYEERAETFHRIIMNLTNFSQFMELFNKGLDPNTTCTLLSNINDPKVYFSLENKKDNEYCKSGKVLFVNVPSFARINKIKLENFVKEYE